MFLLAGVAIAKLRGQLRSEEMTEDLLMKINYIIKCPNPGRFVMLLSLLYIFSTPL